MLCWVQTKDIACVRVYVFVFSTCRETRSNEMRILIVKNVNELIFDEKEHFISNDCCCFPYFIKFTNAVFPSSLWKLYWFGCFHFKYSIWECIQFFFSLVLFKQMLIFPESQEWFLIRFGSTKYFQFIPKWNYQFAKQL